MCACTAYLYVHGGWHQRWTHIIPVMWYAHGHAQGCVQAQVRETGTETALFTLGVCDCDQCQNIRGPQVQCEQSRSL